MKKIFSTSAVLALVLFAGCTKDNFNQAGPVTGGSTLTINIEGTKTHLGDLENGFRKVYWNEGDQIKAGDFTSTSITISDSNPSSATFDFEGSNLVFPCNVLYPAEMWKDASTITLPAVQAAAKGSFGADASPVAAVADGAESPSLKHLAGAIRLRITASDEEHTRLRRVEIRGGAGEQMSGDFTIDYAAATLAPASTADADKVVAARVSQTLRTDEAIDVFIVVPAREYTNGFTVTLIDEAGHYMEQQKVGGVTIGKGEIYALPELPFVPIDTRIDVEISSAEQLVAFAKAYNAGDYDEVNPLVVSLTDDIVFDDVTNAEFEAMGGTDHYFHGNFYGNGKTIRNWVTTKPLFDFTSVDSSISDLTIDASCSITFRDDTDGAMGGFVGYHKGGLTNCHNNAGVTLTGEWSQNARVGGLVGRMVEGKIKNCTMNADVVADAEYLCAGSVYLGGIAGASTNAASVIETSHMRGNVSFSGGVSKNETSYFIGGIIGMLRGTCTDCTNYKENGTTSVNVSALAKDYAAAHVGGIAGDVDGGTFSGNTNYAEVKYEVNGGTYTDIRVGGVAGTNSVSVSKVTNNGIVAVTPGAQDIICHNVFVGGVVGASVKSDNSPSVIELEAVNNGLVIFYGHAKTAKDSDITHNWIAVGGILGYDYKGTCNHIKNSVNNAIVGVSFPAKQNGRATTSGGIVGLLYQNASQIVGCTNSGYILNHNFNNNNGKSNINSGGGAFSGGIVGYAAGQSGVPVIVDNCQNNCSGGPSSYDSSIIYGGIDSDFGLYGLRGNNGGIAGLANSVTISNCVCSADLYQHAQGYFGGLVAWLASSTLEGCTINSDVLKTTDATPVAKGGLAGYVTASTIKNNIFNSALTGNSGTTKGGAGVLVGVSDDATSITDNKVKGTFYDAAITLESPMVGKGSTTVTGTSLYTVQQ